MDFDKISQCAEVFKKNTMVMNLRYAPNVFTWLLSLCVGSLSVFLQNLRNENPAKSHWFAKTQAMLNSEWMLDRVEALALDACALCRDRGWATVRDFANSPYMEKYSAASIAVMEKAVAQFGNGAPPTTAQVMDLIREYCVSCDLVFTAQAERDMSHIVDVLLADTAEALAEKAAIEAQEDPEQD